MQLWRHTTGLLSEESVVLSFINAVLRWNRIHRLLLGWRGQTLHLSEVVLKFFVWLGINMFCAQIQIVFVSAHKLILVIERLRGIILLAEVHHDVLLT